MASTTMKRVVGSAALLAASLVPFVLSAFSFTACGGSSPAAGAPGASSSSGDAGASGDPVGSATAAPTGTSPPPTSPTSTSPAPSSDAGPPAAGADASAPSRKRGIAYGSNTDADLAALSAGIGWWYNWSASPDKTLSKAYAATGVEFVPMIWGGTFDPTQLATQVPAGAKYLLTFNEPNFGAQSNLTPAQAAALWPKVQAFADAHDLAIVSPALNYCGGSCNETNPFTWLDAFFAACTGCRVDYVAAHWYACSKSALQGYLSEYETKYDKPIWLTEFSCLDGSLAATDANEEKYMTDALALLEADPKVFRYSWFTGRSTGSPAISVLGADAGVLTPLGQSYVSLPGGP
jgi:hypothetical protein